MTLDTRVLIKQPHAVQDVFDFINRELLRVGDPQVASWPPEWLTPEQIEYFSPPPGEMRLGNKAGQGLSALMRISYQADGPHRATYMTGEDGDELTLSLGEDAQMLIGSMEVSFDTAYGYRGHADARCGDLHAYFVVRLAEKFGPVVWLDEGGGEWHLLDDLWSGDQVGVVEAKLGSIARGAADVSRTEVRTKAKL